jgi:aspartyl aminopeptidase
MPQKTPEKVEKRRVRKKEESPHSWKRRFIMEEGASKDAYETISGDYITHLDSVFTEREGVDYWVKELSKSGFKDLSRARKLKPGEGFYLVNRERGMVAGIAGKADLTRGANIIVSHLDSPRLDLKPRPVDGDKETGLGFLRTHYYGGIKKYHWFNIPLALKGRVYRGDGSVVDIDIGRGEDDPVLIIPDLEPHLSNKAQNFRKLVSGVRGEELIALAVSSRKMEDDDSISPAVEKILTIVKERYDITEEDLISSDLCLVPAWGPRELGLDRGMIASYGHDNRVSSFASNRALIDIRKKKGIPERWCISFCFDKEEIGSDGPTGAKSAFMELSLYKMLELTGHKGTGRELRSSMSGSFVLSADVKSGVNPNFRGVHDIHNSARCGAGLTITKYTGKGGKSGANDASAEMVSSIKRLFNGNGIIWQMQETGKVDQGGGGTIAKFMAERNMDVLDIGIPLLSMHSPLEVVSKADLYMAVKGFNSFYRNHPMKNDH